MKFPASIAGLMRQLPFSPPQLLWKGKGQLFHRECLITEAHADNFWQAYKRNKGDLLRCGLSITKRFENWYLVQWLNPNLTLTDIGKEMLDRHEKAVTEQKSFEFECDHWEPPCKLPEHLERILYDYQILPARQIFHAISSKLRGGWDSSDTGTGKTFMSGAAAVATGKKVFVVCPVSVKTEWRTIVEKLGGTVVAIESWEAVCNGWTPHATQEGSKIRINLDPNEVIFIFDEAQNARHRDSWFSKLMIASTRQGFQRIAASATMALTPVEMFATGPLVGLHDGTEVDFERFLRAHSCVKTGSTWNFDQSRGNALATINRQIFPRHGARVSVASLGDKFPETQIMCRMIPLSATDKAIVEKHFDEVRMTIARLQRQGDMRAAKIIAQSAWMKAYHASERVMVPYIGRMAREQADEFRHVAVFMNFDDTREMMMSELGTRCAIHGGQRQSERDKWKKRFQADQEEYIVANIKAGGTGTNLHDVIGKYPRTAIIFPNPQAIKVKQALGRVHRAGGVTVSQQYIVFADVEVQRGICNSVRKSLANLDYLNDGAFTARAF